MPPASYSFLKREKGKKNLGTQKEIWSQFWGPERTLMFRHCVGSLVLENVWDPVKCELLYWEMRGNLFGARRCFKTIVMLTQFWGKKPI